MHLNIHEKYQLLVAIIKTATDAAKQNDKLELKRLETLKKLVDVAQITSELNSKSKSSSEESLKTTYTQVKKELITLLSKLNSKVDFEKLFKPSEKTFKQIKESKGIQFSFADIVAYVQKQLIDALNVQNNYEASSSSSSELKTKTPKKAQHGRQRSFTESSIPQIPVLDISPKEKKPGSSNSAQLREEYAQQRPRNISFYKVPSLNISVASSSNAKQSPLSPRPSQIEDNLETYFDDLFACDREKASQFVIALATREYSWGIRALNAASDKRHLDITKTLFENLSESELMHVFVELFKLEYKSTWCRGNQLIYTLLQHYFAQPSMNDFKKFIWNTVFTLNQLFAKINLHPSLDDKFKPASFSAEQKDIEALQQSFTSVLTQLLDPQNFPPLMQEIIKRGYHDLVNRNDITNNDSVIRSLISFIALRFINAIIQIEAREYLTLDNLNALGIINLQTDEKEFFDGKLLNLQIWYIHVFSSALQGIAAPLVSVEQSKQQASRVEQKLEQQSLASALFNSVVHNEDFRMSLYAAVKDGLQLQLLEGITPTHNDNKIVSLNYSATIKQLSELLMTEEFSGLTFRKDGAVTSPRKEEKTSIFSLFTTEPTSPKDSSSTPIHSSKPFNG